MKQSIIKLWYYLTYRFTKPKLMVTKAVFSGDESFIDIRYWLSRPDKINTKSTPYLLTSDHQKIGLMHISKFGAVKSRMRKHTNSGILLFYNSNHAINYGTRFTLYWDNLKMDVELNKDTTKMHF